MAKTISYEPFDKLIESLRSDGIIEGASRLNYMLHEVPWTSGSELIGELGMEIKKIRQDCSSKLSKKSSKWIKDSMKMVKRVWPDFPDRA